MIAQGDNKLCEYSYYIDNYFQCVITGDKCINGTPDGENCINVRDKFLESKQRGVNNIDAGTDK